MKTNYNEFIYPYILDCIGGEGYGVEFATDIDRLRFLHDTFFAEYGDHVPYYGGSTITTFAEWCKGLPSVFNIAWTNCDILDLAREWGALPENATASQEQKILDNYWNLIANKTFQLFRRYLD